MMSSAGSACSRLCMTITGTPRAATSGAMAGSRCRPQTSLTIVAPCIERPGGDFRLDGVDRHRKAELDGRRQHVFEPRLFLGRRHRLHAAIGPRRFRADVEDVGALRRHFLGMGDGSAGSRNRPPSEKESGVTLRMPMTSGRPRPSRPAADRRPVFGRFSAGRGRAPWRPALRMAGKGCQAYGPFTSPRCGRGKNLNTEI